uniref:Alpha-(1,6)-fucosyltransferase n=1 Tax=Ciona intestinalis TaxID=7719 RepID=H2Y0T7_CIOIN
MRLRQFLHMDLRWRTFIVTFSIACCTFFYMFQITSRKSRVIVEGKFTKTERWFHNNDAGESFDLQERQHIRNAMSDVEQIQAMVRHQLIKIYQESPKAQPLVIKMIKQFLPLKSALTAEIEELKELTKQEDGELFKKLRKTVARRIDLNQNPAKCSTAKKLYCNVQSACGFGCIIHHYTICLFISLGTGRVMMSNMSNLAYPNMDKIFLPLSRTCLTAEGNVDDYPEWESPNDEHPSSSDAPIVKVSIVYHRDRKTPFAPWTVPKDLIPSLERIHGNPMLWWIGQLQSYLMRPQKWLSDSIKEAKGEEFQHPIVGVHVRRSDKISEASYMANDAYMTAVSDWYDTYEMRHPNETVVRRIFLATDDILIGSQLKITYPKYRIVQIQKNAVVALAKRFSGSGLEGILQDVFLMAECDYFVGTMSSNVGRLVHELMQTRDYDTSNAAITIDHSFRYYGQFPERHLVLNDHHAENPCPPEFEPLPPNQFPKYVRERLQLENILKQGCEVELRKGDIIDAWPELNNNYMRGGVNIRSGRWGLYPKFKVKQIIEPAPYPVIENTSL